MASKKKQQNLFSNPGNKLAEYEAKQRAHELHTKRRARDNRLAVIAAVGALLLAAGAQIGYTMVNPTPTATVATSATPTPVQTNAANVPNPAIAQGRLWTGSMEVNGDPLGLTLFGDKAPQATANFIDLANKDFYKGVSCHRLTTAGLFVLQCGDPSGDGTGGPGYSFGPIENAPQATSAGTAIYKKGVLAMANSGGAYTQGSQFFIVYADTSLLPDYTVFGEITSGLESLDPIIKAGVQGGGTDGKPVTAVSLGTIKLN